jgi:DivIVA domain-containing protein
MGQLLLLLVVALTVAAVVFGVTVLVTGNDPGLVPAEPDGRAVPLPATRPLLESDVADVRFDTALRGYRMTQVDQAMRRAAYDIGYKGELIGVLEAEVTALREGRTEDADALRQAREAALGEAKTTAGIGGAGTDLGSGGPIGGPSTPDCPEPGAAAAVIELAGDEPPVATEDAAAGHVADDATETAAADRPAAPAEDRPEADSAESDAAGSDLADSGGPVARSRRD